MESTLKFCGVAVLGAACALILRELRRETEIPARLAAVTLLLSCCASMAEPVVKYITALLNASPLSPSSVTLLIRIFGIALLCRLSADVCRELGSPSVAAALECAARLEIVLLTLPVVTEVTDLIGELLRAAGG